MTRRLGSAPHKATDTVTRLIINADDLGADAQVNDAIFALMQEGLLTSATLLANGKAIEDAAHRAQKFPQCSFGVHLNLTESRPLTHDPNLGPLLDAQGAFVKQALRSTRMTSQLWSAALSELSAQVARVKLLGVRISHFDSHHHIHTIPMMFGVLKELQRRFGIRKVRASMNLYPEPLPVMALLKKALWNWALRRFYRTTTTESFTYLNVFLEVANRLSRPPRSIELMTHPGAQGTEAEMGMLRYLCSKQAEFPVKLVTYDQL